MSSWQEEAIERFGTTKLLRTYSFKSRDTLLASPKFFGGTLPSYFSEKSSEPGQTVDVTVFSNVILHHGDVFGLGALPQAVGELGYIPQNANDIQGTLIFDEASLIRGNSFLYSTHHSAHNFYHFLADYLPYDSLLGILADAQPVLVCKEHNTFQDQIMHALLGRLLPLRYFATSYFFERLAIPSILNKTDVVDFLRSRSQYIEPAGAHRRIYISRRNAVVRRVLNEDRVIDILKTYGFEIIESETLAFIEQIALFKASDIVCAPHGAGLTNIAFCPEGTRIIEFFFAERLPLSGLFWEIGCAAGLAYSFVKTDRITNKLNPHPMEGDLLVDLAALTDALTSAITQPILERLEHGQLEISATEHKITELGSLSSIAYYYFCTLDNMALKRLSSSVAKQRLIDRMHAKLGNSKRVLVCDCSDVELPPELSEFFSGGIHRCDPFIQDAQGYRHFNMSKLRNLAIKVARGSNEDWLYFCDADTILVEDSVPPQDAKYCVPNVYWQRTANESLDVSLQNIRLEGNKAFSVGNSWFILHRDIFTRFDFNENMYGYGFEDIEYFARITANGWSLETVSGLVIHNYHGHSERNIVPSVLDRNKAIFDAGCLARTWNPRADWRKSKVFSTEAGCYYVYFGDLAAVTDPTKGWVRHASIAGDSLRIFDDQPEPQETFRIGPGNVLYPL